MFMNPDTKVSNMMMAESMKGFNIDRNLDELEAYYADFWDNILHIFATRSREYAFKFFTHLFPRSDQLEEHLEKIEELIKECPDE